MPIVDCKLCGSSFYVKPSHQKLGWGKYCSFVCRSKAQIKGKNIKCSVCSKLIFRSQSKLKHSESGNFFCSKHCQIKWRNHNYIEQKHPNWINGINAYRRILQRSNRELSCECCNFKDKRVLVVHHVDHDRKNNSINNLIWVCLNCHFLIHHDKDFETKLKIKMVTVAQVV